MPNISKHCPHLCCHLWTKSTRVIFIHILCIIVYIKFVLLHICFPSNSWMECRARINGAFQWMYSFVYTESQEKINRMYKLYLCDVSRLLINEWLFRKKGRTVQCRGNKLQVGGGHWLTINGLLYICIYSKNQKLLTQSVSSNVL